MITGQTNRAEVAFDVRYGSKSGHDALKFPCLLYTQKRTLPPDRSMSALCHKQTLPYLPNYLVGGTAV
jgi:hypothetical protein